MSGLPHQEVVTRVDLTTARESYEPNQSVNDTSMIGGVVYRNVRVSRYSNSGIVSWLQQLITVLKEILQATVMIIAQYAIKKIPLHN